MLPGFYAVDEAATWRESYRSYLGRSHRRKSVVTTNCEKSAEAIVPSKGRAERTKVF